MGGASPYRARFIGLPPGSRDSDALPSDGGQKYSGLVNVANTCYVNSVVQALYFCTPFRKNAIRQLQEEREEDGFGDTLLGSLASLFAQIENQKRPVGCLTPRHFLAKLRKANDLFGNAEHQDAHEFMQFLLNDIAETSKKRAKRQRERERERAREKEVVWPAGGANLANELPEEEPHTWVHDVFQGYLVNQMKCLCCENVSVRKESFLDLSVDIERHTSIAACLRAFESTELLRAGNKFFCDACGCLQEAEKRLRIYQLPTVLTLHLKRFKYVERLGRCCRLPYRVVFPLQLRVVEHRPPRQGDGGGTAGASPGAGVGAGGAATDASDGLETSQAGEPPQAPSRLFELRSVVVHIGRDSSRGHYVTVVRNGDRCVLLDDDVVRVVEPEVLRSFYGTSGRLSQNPDRYGSSGTWSGSDTSGSRFGSRDPFSYHHSPGPLYERSPEGTCCGYILLYEAVDAAGVSPGDDAAATIDVGSAADWLSEERHQDESDSGESAEASASDRRTHLACDDSELTQAFEQRCVPRTRSHQPAAGVPAQETSSRQRHSPAAPASPLSCGASRGERQSGAAAAVPAVIGHCESATPSRSDAAMVLGASSSPQSQAAHS